MSDAKAREQAMVQLVQAARLLVESIDAPPLHGAIAADENVERIRRAVHELDRLAKG